MLLEGYRATDSAYAGLGVRWAIVDVIAKGFKYVFIKKPIWVGFFEIELIKERI